MIHPRETFLDNGLKVVLVPAGAAPVATLMVVYRVGARNEAVGYTGASHLLEHMLFKGTPANNRANGRAFADIMHEIGANKNATTWLDRTNYFETVPLGYLDLAIELEADRMRGALIADDDRASEMTVVRNELERNDNDPGRVLSAALVATAFREHPYHHPTIGWRSDVEGVSTERLRDLYDTFYRPNNATVFVVGAVDAARTLETIERHFGGIPASSTPIPEVHTEEPPQAGERSVVVKRPGETAIVALAFHTPAACGQHTVLNASELARRVASRSEENDTYALEVLGRVLSDGRTSRLSRALVDAGLALDVSAWNWATRDPGLFTIVADVRPGSACDDVRRTIDGALTALAQTGPEAEEVERAYRQIAVQRAFSRDGTFALAQRLGEFEAAGSWRLDSDYVERIRAVTRDDVRAAAQAYLHEDNRTLGTLLPGTAKTFARVPFEPVSARAEIAPRIVDAPALPRPRSATVESFADRVAAATLPNGIEWRYVANDATPTVHVRGVLDAGPAYASDHPALCAVLAAMLARGTQSMPRRELEERLERQGIQRSYFVDSNPSAHYNPLAFRFSGSCAEGDLPILLETLAAELREPAFAAEELALVKANLIGALATQKTNTGWRAMQRFLQLAYETGDPNAWPDIETLVSDVEAIDLPALQAFHRARVLSSPCIVSAAGAPRDAVFAGAVESTLGNVPLAAGACAPPTVRRRTPREARANVTLERKANVDVVIGRAAALVRADEGYLAAQLANGMLGQSTLSSRLGLRLRDRDGLTYGVTSAFASAGRIAGPWRIALSVNPANVERALSGMRDVLRDFADRGPSDREIVRQRNSMAGSHHVALATNAGVAVQLERIAYYRLPADYVDTYRDRIEAVTREDVVAAIASFFGADDLLIAAAGTFENS